MVECSAVREQMPELLLEALAPSEREAAHQHIEGCPSCAGEWRDSMETWKTLGELPDVEVPVAVRTAFLTHIGVLQDESKVVPFPRRFAWKWVAQAAAVVLLAGGSFWAGNHTTVPAARPAAATQTITSTGIVPASYSLAQNRVIAADQLSPQIEGSPQIENVQFVHPSNDPDKVSVSFDVTSHVTINGRPSDKSLVQLLSYVLQNQDHPGMTRSATIDWVKDTYSGDGVANPEIVRALASVLRNDAHEGARIKAVETLQSMPASLAPESRAALIQAVQNDPNPAVRIKAIDALGKLARSGGTLDPTAVDTLRKKATQDDENAYVRVKAAEVLGQISL